MPRSFLFSIKSLSIIFCFMITDHSFAEPLNLALAKNQVIQYYDSGEYLKELSQVTSKANAFINKTVKDYKGNKKLAIVLDIDETSISNYASIKKLEFSDNYTKIRIELQKGMASTIYPMLSLYKNALKQGVKIFFITGRDDGLKEATIKNLHLAGYKDWSSVYFHTSRTKNLSTIQYKTAARKDIYNKGYLIIASIGDQYSDLKGGYAMQTFKLPNPFYYLE